jgi:hypothetical protein
MKPFVRLALAAAILAAVPVSAVAADACASDPAAAGLRGRIANMSEKMQRIRHAAGPEEQQRLLALHAKLMREGLRELRARPASVPCRLEMTEAMMDQMLLHEAEREGPGY